MKLTSELVYDFRGCGIPGTTGSATVGPFTKAITGSAPTFTKTVDGLVMSLTNDTEAQNLCLYTDDVLSFDIDLLSRIEFLVKFTRTSATIPNVQLALGLASARNAAIDSIANQVLFRAIADLSILLESDNGTTDVDDIDSGVDLINGGWMLFVIDFDERTLTQGPPSVSKGGKANIALKVASVDLYGTFLRTVGEGTTFTLDGVTGGLQPFIQLQKTSAAANICSLAVKQIKVFTKDN